MNERRDGGYGMGDDGMGKDGVGDELDRRLDQALRRRFEAPATLDDLCARALAPRPRGRALRPWMLLAAAAAVALFLFVPWRSAREDERAEPVPRRERVATLAPVPASTVSPACRRSGPFESPTARPGQVHSPDLVQLYVTMDACQRSAAQSPCSEADDLALQLAATYGGEIELRPDALGFLQGPFGSADLPTATILTGSSENHTSVLVAERGATLDCCLCMSLPPQSGLRMFTWQVGALVLTEITPLAEPRLLEFFE